MRPIQLKIRGLNSFTEEQIIDFEKLTSRGLFGIFGPTGSGKTSILDGITLSLYGDISRSTKEFINANEEAAYVSFEFEISGSERTRYRVEREFRRSKSGGITTKYARILSGFGGEMTVLEERPAKVDDQCEAIIGLTKDDFTRTVVLPQGKFSDFLKLKNKDRGEMLERLFNLQAYGDELTAKLSRHAKAVRQQESELSGQLRAYADVTPEVLDEAEKAYQHQLTVLAEDRIKQEAAEQAFAKAQGLWQLQQDLTAAQEKLQTVQSQTAVYQAMEKQIQSGEQAARLMPQVTEWQRLSAAVAALKTQEAEQKAALAHLMSLWEDQQTVHEALSQRWTQEWPQLQTEASQLNNAVAEKQALAESHGRLALMAEQASVLGTRLKDLEMEIQQLEIQMAEKNKMLEETQTELEANRLTAVYKAEVQRQKQVLDQWETAKEQHSRLTEKSLLLKNDLLTKTTELEMIQAALSAAKASAEEAEALLKTLEEAPRVRQEDLLSQNQALQEARGQWAALERCQAQMAADKDQEAVLLKAVKLQQSALEALEAQRSEISRKLIDQGLMEKARQLRQLLAEGEPCLVCGSVHHPLMERHPEDTAVNGEDGENLVVDLEAQLRELETNLRNLEKKQIEDETKAQQLAKGLSELENQRTQLWQVFKEKSLEQMEADGKALEAAWKAQQLQLKQQQEINRERQQSLTEVMQQASGLQSTVAFQKNQLAELEQEAAQLEAATLKTGQELEKSQQSHGISDIRAAFDQMLAKERAFEALSKTAEGLQGDLKLMAAGLNEQREKRQKTAADHVVLVTQHQVGMAAAQEKQVKLESEFGHLEGLESRLEANIQAQIALKSQFEKAQETFNQLSQTKRQLEDQYQTTVNHLSLQSDNEHRASGVLKGLLEGSDFENLEAVKQAFLPNEELERLKGEYRRYHETRQQLSGAIAQLEAKLGDQRIDPEAYLDLESKRTAGAEALRLLGESCASQKTALDQLKQRFEQMKDLILEKEAIDQSLAYISDLEKLFQGKRFVAYIAAHQLKYISGKASEQLFDISLGNYGLETDEEGNFTIRDYKNGGALRDPSSLSGGETFMVSLALALALSAQIQLKGRAPLEFFFLDEGFGTLDEDTLEVVMSALERLHHERLSIGLISHVESIKNRVPIKLMVTPAKSGMGGSKVSVELS